MHSIVGCYMLHPFAHPVACMLLRVVVQSLKLVKLLSQKLPTFLLFRDRFKSSATMLDPFAQLFPTLMGPRMHITNGLQSLMSCILPMMHCWEFLHPFTHQCQNGCNNSQYCWPNSVGSCCIHLQVTLGSEEFKLPTYQL